MLEYTDIEKRFECRICRSLKTFREVRNMETGERWYNNLEKHKIYKVRNEEGEYRDIFICRDCLEFFRGLVKECVSNLQSGKKAESK
jgi:hypothetical protein